MRRARPWMQVVLWLAAFYNVAWGAFAIFFPNAIFDWAAMQRPLYPELWQCIGMIVGVYGVAYAAAATDPFRHWAAVAAGLLGKVLGPIGFASALLHHRFTLAFGATLLFNDLIWWVPFGLILYRVYQAHITTAATLAPEITRLALRTRTQTGVSLDTLSREGPVLLVFLRHSGCTFCREALADLARQRQKIESLGGCVVLVHMGTEDEAAALFAKYGVSDFLHVSDPQRSLYRAFALSRGGVKELFGPKVWRRGIEAGILGGYGVGLLAGDGFQMPGVFVVYHGEILRSFRHQTAADRPDYVALLADAVTTAAPGRL